MFAICGTVNTRGESLAVEKALLSFCNLNRTNMAGLADRSSWYNGGPFPPCRFFLRGKCTRGADCPFLHDGAAAAAAKAEEKPRQAPPRVTTFGDDAQIVSAPQQLKQWRGTARTTHTRTDSTRENYDAPARSADAFIALTRSWARPRSVSGHGNDGAGSHAARAYGHRLRRVPSRCWDRSRNLLAADCETAGRAARGGNGHCHLA